MVAYFMDIISFNHLMDNSSMNLKQIWEDLKFSQDCDRSEGGIDWAVERSDEDWAEIAKKFDKYLRLIEL